MKYKISFEDIIGEVESEEQVYDILLDYLNECVRNEDITAFNIEQVKE